MLADVVTSSLITADDVESERGVILEEIAMHDDDPSDVVHEAFSDELYGDTPIGRPILGNDETINALTRDRIHEYYQRFYLPTHTVISVAGQRVHEHVVELVVRAYERAGALGGDAAPIRPASAAPGTRPTGGVKVVDRPTEQANLVLGTTGVSRTDEPQVRPRRPQRRARRRHVLAPVPGDPGEARPGLQRLQLHLAVRRHRPVRGVRRVPARQDRRRPQDLP